MNDAESVKSVLMNRLKRNPDFFGSAVAFKPNTFPNRKLFSPYVYRDTSGSDDLHYLDIGAEGYDYTDGNLGLVEQCHQSSGGLLVKGVL